LTPDLTRCIVRLMARIVCSFGSWPALSAACLALASCQAVPAPRAPDAPADLDGQVRMIIADVDRRNPDRAALCRKGFETIRYEVTTSGTDLVMKGRIGNTVYAAGTRATQLIYGGCVR
jgi:hypothetical protein